MKPKKPADGHRQGLVNHKALRHIGDLVPRTGVDMAMVRLDESQCGFDQGAFAGTVGTDQGHNLSAIDRKGNAVEYGTPTPDDADIAQLQ